MKISNYHVTDFTISFSDSKSQDPPIHICHMDYSMNGLEIDRLVRETKMYWRKETGCKVKVSVRSDLLGVVPV